MFHLQLRDKPAELLAHIEKAHLASSLKRWLMQALAKIEGEAEHVVSVTGEAWNGNPFATADAEIKVEPAEAQLSGASASSVGGGAPLKEAALPKGARVKKAKGE